MSFSMFHFHIACAYRPWFLSYIPLFLFPLLFSPLPLSFFSLFPFSLFPLLFSFIFHLFTSVLLPFSFSLLSFSLSFFLSFSFSSYISLLSFSLLYQLYQGLLIAYSGSSFMPTEALFQNILNNLWDINKFLSIWSNITQFVFDQKSHYRRTTLI